MKLIAFLLGLLGVGMPLLCGQDDGRAVKFRMLCYEQAKDVTKAMVMGDGNSKNEVMFFAGDFGPQLTGKFTGGKVRFFTESPGPDKKPIVTIVAEGDLVPSNTQAFILFPQNKEKAPTYKVVAFDDLEASFPMGATRVINLANCQIRLNLAGTDMPPIKPGGVEVYPQVKKFDDWHMYTARVDFALEANKWTPVATQSWKSSARKRDWVIAQIDPETHQPSIRIYQDIPPWRQPVLPIGGKKDHAVTGITPH